MLSAELVHRQQQGLFQPQERPTDSEKKGFNGIWYIHKLPLQVSCQALNLAHPLQLACHGG